MKWKVNLLFCVGLMSVCIGQSPAVTVSWDGTSSDVTSLGSNVNSTPNAWTTADSVWNTTDEIVSAVGGQASFKSAIGIVPGQRKVAQINASSDLIFVGGNELAPTDKTPYTTVVGFDTSAFGDVMLKSISMTLRSRVSSDSMDVRWFVEAGGSTYVSDIIATVGGANVTLTLPDARAIPWFVFDADMNIGSAIEDASSLMELSNVTHVGYHTTSRFTNDANWHGAFLSNFSATAVHVIAWGPDPADGATGVAATQILSWTPGAGAISHDVWFGESADALELVSDDQGLAEYTPSTLIKGRTYYWAVDEYDGTNTYLGPVWSFTVTAASGTANWTNADSINNLWISEDNWSAGVPGVGSSANIHTDGPVLIDSSVEAVATGNWCRWGIADPNVDPTVLDMTGGSLTVHSLALGNGGPAVVNMSDGIIDASGNLIMGDSDGGDTTLNINGGTVNIGGTLKSKINATTNFINLHGGVLAALGITLNSGVDPNHLGTIMDITGGTMILEGDGLDSVITSIGNGHIIAYGGTGHVLVDYDVTNPGKTTVTGFELVFEYGDFTNDNYVDMDDLAVLAQEWLFQMPTQFAWSFDMVDDPVGQGDFELEIRSQVENNNHYIMGDETGTGTLEVTGEGILLLDSHVPDAVGLFDTTIHYVVKTTSSNPLNLWYIMGTSTNPGEQAYVGISTSLSGGVQTVEMWTGVPPDINGYAPVTASGFNESAYLDITVEYNYETDSFDWTVTDGTTTSSGTAVAYTYFNNGDGGEFTLQGKNGATGFVDQLDVVIHGANIGNADSDVQPDDSVDLIDFAALAEEWYSDGFPTFSWDHVPLYAHVGIGNGLELDQYNFLADHFDLVTLTGGPMPTGTMEPNFGVAARAIKRRNPNVKLLSYWASDKPKGQWKLSNATFPEGGYLPTETKNFDVTREDVRNWWSDVAAKAVQVYGCDGIFVDGATAGRPGGPWSKLFGAEHAAALDAGMFAMLEEANKKMGPGKLNIFNPLHGYVEGQLPLGEQYLPVTDGAMVDDFDRAANLNQQSPEYMANTIEIMRQSAKDGNIIVFKAWPGFTWWSDPNLMEQPHEEQYQVAKENILFPLACFLIGAEPNCYFCYTWGWLAEYGTFDWYPEFDKPLGPPLGDAVRDGWTYQREFEHASVFLDLENKIGQIDWR